MKTTWTKQIRGGVHGLFPACPAAEEWLAKTKLGQDVMIEPKRPRNVQHHRKLFALLNLAVENWPGEKPTTVEALLGAIKISAGHYDAIQTKQGEWKIPKSIAFESMGQDEFEPFYNHAVLVISRVLGVDIETLEQEARAA